MKQDKAAVRKPDESELSYLRTRVKIEKRWFLAVFIYNCFCILVFLVMLYPLVYGVSLNSNIPRGAGFVGFGLTIGLNSLLLIPPLIINTALVWSKIKPAMYISVVLTTGLFIIEYINSLNEIGSSVFLYLPLYFAAITFIIIKKPLPCIASLILGIILFFAAEFENFLISLHYPHVLLFASSALVALSFERCAAFDELKKVEGFPYFLQRQLEYDGIYKPIDFVAPEKRKSTPDELVYDDVLPNLSQADEKCKKNPTIDVLPEIHIDENETLCDSPLSDSTAVEKYTRELREKINKSRKVKGNPTE